MLQAEIISDRLTKFIYLKMLDDRVLLQNDLVATGIDFKKIIREAIAAKVDLGIINTASAKYGVIGTKESDEAIKSYLLGIISKEELANMLGKEDPSYMIKVYKDRFKITNIHVFKEKCREPVFIRVFSGEISREQGAEELHLTVGGFKCAYYNYLKNHPNLAENKEKEKLDTENTYLMMYYRNEIDTATLAAALHISRSYASTKFSKFMEDNNLPKKDYRKLCRKFTKKAPYNDPAYEYLFKGYFTGKYSITYISKVTKYARNTIYTYLSDFRKTHPEYKNIKMQRKPPKHDKIFKDYMNHKITLEEAMKEAGDCKTKRAFYSKLCFYKKHNGIQTGRHTIYTDEILLKVINREMTAEEALKEANGKSINSLKTAIYRYKITHDIPVKKHKSRKKEE